MKRLLFIALLGLSLIPELAYAQRRGRGRTPAISLGFTFGAKLGGAFSNFAGYDAVYKGQPQSYAGRFGPTGGGLVNYRFTQQISVQAEGMYTPRGANQSLGKSTGLKETVFKLNYFDLPLLGKFNAKIFYFEAGVVPAFLLSESATKDGVKQTESTGLKGLDIGYTIGGGIEVPIGAIFGIRYVRSTSAIGQGGLLVGGQALENSVVQVTGGYIFNHASSGRGRRR
ncbi:MAG: PorT family protein [Hymenobacteraceae bacterium]|nr:PorT family protein [Hymenobacteraceae bacterium]